MNFADVAFAGPACAPDVAAAASAGAMNNPEAAKMFANLLAAIELPPEGTPIPAEESDGDGASAQTLPQIATAPAETQVQPQLQPAQPLGTLSITRPVLWMANAETSQPAAETQQGAKATSQVALKAVPAETAEEVIPDSAEDAAALARAIATVESQDTQPSINSEADRDRTEEPFEREASTDDPGTQAVAHPLMAQSLVLPDGENLTEQAAHNGRTSSNMQPDASQDVSSLREPRGPRPGIEAFSGTVTPKTQAASVSAASAAVAEVSAQRPADFVHARASQAVAPTVDKELEPAREEDEPAAPTRLSVSTHAWATTEGRDTSAAPASEPASVQEVHSVRLAPEPPPAATGPVKRLTVSVPGESDTRTDIHFVERNGSLNLDVRTTRPEVAENLQRELPELVRTLETNGYRSEMSGVDSGSDAASSAEALGLKTGSEVSADSESFENGGEEDRSAREYRRDGDGRDGRRQRRQQQERYEDELYAN